MKKFLKVFRRTNYFGNTSGYSDAIPMRLAAAEDERTAYIQAGVPRAQATQVILYHPGKTQANGDTRRRLAIVVPVPPIDGVQQRPFRTEVQVDTPMHADAGNMNANLALNILIDLLVKMQAATVSSQDHLGTDGTVRTIAEGTDASHIAADFRSLLQGDVATY